MILLHILRLKLDHPAAFVRGCVLLIQRITIVLCRPPAEG